MDADRLRTLLSFSAIPLVPLAFAPCFIGGRLLHNLAVVVVLLGVAAIFGGLAWAATIDGKFVVRGTTVRREDSEFMFSFLMCVFVFAALMSLGLFVRAVYVSL